MSGHNRSPCASTESTEPRLEAGLPPAPHPGPPKAPSQGRGWRRPCTRAVPLRLTANRSTAQPAGTRTPSSQTRAAHPARPQPGPSTGPKHRPCPPAGPNRRAYTVAPPSHRAQSSLGSPGCPYTQRPRGSLWKNQTKHNLLLNSVYYYFLQ